MVNTSQASRGICRASRGRRVLSVVALGTLLLGTVAGCGGNKKDQTTAPAAAAAPPPTYTGPGFLRGTVSSMASLRPGDDKPLLVGGHGVVFFPPGAGTGSAETPAFLKQKVINDMRRMGVGSPSMAAQAPDELKPFMSLSPERLLDSDRTAVVAVQGLIPPGATVGQRFDLLISAVDTQTTSLTGSTLWTTPVGVGGTDPRLDYVRPQATAYGETYLDPKGPRNGQSDRDWQRQAVIVLGGTVKEARRIELVLHQPSWTRSRLIANRINERFGRSTDPRLVAEPQTDLRIRINIPDRWSGRAEEFLELVAHHYTQAGPTFVPEKAEDLAQRLVKEPEHAYSVTMAWKALGPNAVPILQRYYGNASMAVRLAALDAGAYLGDMKAGHTLEELSHHPDPQVRIKVAQAFSQLPQSNTGEATLRRLLDDADQPVRIAAYESLARINASWLIRRLDIKDERGRKFLIDRVPSTKPLVYITQEGTPRLVIFGPETDPQKGPDLPFDLPILARVWNNRLMLRAEAPNQPMSLFYQRPGMSDAKVHQVYPQSVAALAYVMGHKPHGKDLQEGLGLSYGQVVDAIYQLVREGYLQVPVEFNESRLARQVDELQSVPDGRPELLNPPSEIPGAAPTGPTAVPTTLDTTTEAGPAAEAVASPNRRAGTP